MSNTSIVTSANEYSNLIDLKSFFYGVDDYVILKLPDYFPNYHDYNDIDILCYNPEQLCSHILSIGESYKKKGFNIIVTKSDSHLHIDFYPPGSNRLNFRFDLLATLDSYKKFSIDKQYHLLVLASQQKIVHNGVEIFVPALEHDLTVRFLEYFEWKDDRPSKSKHFEYIKQINDLSFIDIVNKHTSLQISVVSQGNSTNMQISCKQRNDTGNPPVRRFYQVTPSCQIPDLAKIFEDFFGKSTDGCFVEFGAFDGEYVSNTSGLADMGWTGYYLEPVPEYFERCKQRHERNSNIKVIQAAIGSEPGNITINVGGPLSTISDEMRSHFEKLDWSRDLFKESVKIEVNQITLEHFLASENIKPGFELLVVDVEGQEWDVFRNFDISKWHPQMVIIELHDQNDDYLIIRENCLNIVKYFKLNDYVPIFKDSTNTIYVQKSRLFKAKHRMDYFLIWGHGLPFTNQIVDIIRKHKNFEIISIVKKKIDDIAKFVSNVYACDTVPFEHLINKTRYLLTTNPEIVFILTENKNPQEKFFGEGKFRHIQCQVVKDIKEEVRNKFNPRMNGERSEDHVIHASDYESQVEHVLKVLGLPTLGYYKQEPNPELDVPYHLGGFGRYLVLDVEIDKLYASILGNGMTPIHETPHYQYVAGEKAPYHRYHQAHFGVELTDDHFPEAFDMMIENFRYDFMTEEGKRSMIFAKQMEGGKYRILDGVHRAAILKHRGVKMLTIAVLDEKRNCLQETRPKVACVIFSKDRAMQLDATLRSLSSHCIDKDFAEVKVIYRASSPDFEAQYLTLRSIFPSVEFIRENVFKNDVVNSISGSDFVLFTVDDTCFTKELRLQQITSAILKNPDAIGFSLRLGMNTDYCYMRNAQQALPDFAEVGEQILKYDWTTAEHDFGYPLEVSSSIYRSEDIQRLLNALSFVNPNTLESQLHENRGIFSARNNHLLCFRTSIAFCNPVNIVQDTCAHNRSGKNLSYSGDNLAKLFNKGFRINISAYDGFVTNSAHQELPLELDSHFDSRQSSLTAPKVSVIIPCYNSASFLADCLDSLICQTLTDWEAIVVDDCSTLDDPSEVMSRYTDNRITLLRHDRNRGLAASRNTGFSHARSDLVFPLDADDMITPEFLERTVSALHEHPQADCIFTHFRLFGAQNEVWRWETRDSEEMTRNQWIPGPGTLMRRALWERIGGYCEDEELRLGNEDWDYWLSALRHHLYPITIAEPLYLYRRHQISMSTNLMYKDFQTRNHIYQRHKDLFDRFGTGALFCAQGYLNGAKAAWKRNELLRASLLAAQAWKIISMESTDKNSSSDWGQQEPVSVIHGFILRLRQNSDDMQVWFSYGRYCWGMVSGRQSGLSLLEEALGDKHSVSDIIRELEPHLTLLDDCMNGREASADLSMSYANQKHRNLQALKNDPLSEGLWLSLGELAYKENDLETAKAAYEAARSINPDNWKAFLYLWDIAFLQDGKKHPLSF